MPNLLITFDNNTQNFGENEETKKEKFKSKHIPRQNSFQQEKSIFHHDPYTLQEFNNKNIFPLFFFSSFCLT